MKKSESDSSISNDAILLSAIVLLFVAVIFIVVFFIEMNKSEINTCGEGTFYGNCSLNKPYFCSEGILIINASLCGCPDVLVKKEDFCVSGYEINPRNISLTYFLNGQFDNINFKVYGGFYNFTKKISRLSDGDQSTNDLKLKIVNNEEQREMILPLVVEIQNLAKDENEQVKIAVSLVQLIPYDDSESNFSLFYQAINSRYPYEVIYDEIGVCGEKSNLLAFLLKELGYNVSIFYFPNENHEAVGIKCSSSHDFMDTGYCFVETTGLIGENGDTYIGATREFSSVKIFEISEGKSLSNKFFNRKSD